MVTLVSVSLHLAYCCTATAHCSTYSCLRNLVTRSLKRWFLICETLWYLKLFPLRHQIQFHQITSIFTPPNTLRVENPHHYISAGVFIVKTNSGCHRRIPNDGVSFVNGTVRWPWAYNHPKSLLLAHIRGTFVFGGIFAFVKSIILINKV